MLFGQPVQTQQGAATLFGQPAVGNSSPSFGQAKIVFGKPVDNQASCESPANTSAQSSGWGFAVGGGQAPGFGSAGQGSSAFGAGAAAAPNAFGAPALSPVGGNVFGSGSTSPGATSTGGGSIFGAPSQQPVKRGGAGSVFGRLAAAITGAAQQSTSSPPKQPTSAFGSAAGLEPAAAGDVPSRGGGRGAGSKQGRGSSGRGGGAGGRAGGRGGRRGGTPDGDGASGVDEDEQERRRQRMARFETPTLPADVERTASPAPVSGDEGVDDDELDGSDPSAMAAMRESALQPRPFLGGGGVVRGGGGSAVVGGTAAQSAPAPRGSRLGGGSVGRGLDEMTGDDVGGGGTVDGDPDSNPEFTIVGTCEDMCPEAERLRRSAAGELHMFERVDPANSRLTTPELIVKKAVRNYDDEDKKPSSFRTIRALAKTMAHLRGILDRPIAPGDDAAHVMVHGFLWDRFREVRKEINTQRFHFDPSLLPTIIAWNEEICRFFLASSHDLIDKQGFQAHLNQEQMNKVLLDLLDYYKLALRYGIDTPNSAEFKCYHAIMLYAGVVNKHNKKNPNKLGALEVLRAFTPAEQASPWYQVMCATLNVLNLVDTRNFNRLFSAAPYILACVLFTQAPYILAYGVSFAAKAYDASQDPDNWVPVSGLVGFLGVGPTVSQSRASALGAEVYKAPPGSGQESHIRFPYLDTQSHVPNTGYKKVPYPNVVNKGMPGDKIDRRSQVIAVPPDLTQPFLDTVAGILGRPSGSIRADPEWQRRQQEQLEALSREQAKHSRLALPPQPAAVSPARAAASPAFGQQSAAAAFQPVKPGASGGLFGVSPAPAQPPMFPGQPKQPSPAAFGQGRSVQPEVSGPGTLPAAGAAGSAPAGGSQSLFGTASTPQGPAPPSPRSANVQAELEAARSAAQAAAAAKAQAEAQAAQAYARAQAEAAERAHQVAALQQQAMESQRGMQMHVEQVQRHAYMTAQALQRQIEAQAAQLAILQQQHAASEKLLAKQRLKEQEQYLRELFERRLLTRTLLHWQQAAADSKEQSARTRERLMRCRIESIARGIRPAALSVLSPDAPQAAGLTNSVLAASVAGGAGSKRRRTYDELPDVVPAAAPPGTASRQASDQATTSHLALPEVILPPLAKALSAATSRSATALAAQGVSQTTGSGAAGMWHPSSQASLPWSATSHSGRALPPSQQEPYLWKIMVSTGTEEGPQQLSRGGSVDGVLQGSTAQGSQAAGGITSALHVSAAAWLKAKLSCGRSPGLPRQCGGTVLTHIATTLPSTALQPGTGGGASAHTTSSSSSSIPLVLCVTCPSVSSVADEAPAQTGYSSAAMAATSGIMLLVGGPDPATLHSSSSSPSGSSGSGVFLSSEVQAELHQSWAHLRVLLERLPVDARVPLVLLALTSNEGVHAVGRHLEAAASEWPVAIAAHVASFRVIPLLPVHLAEAALVDGLCELASHPPAMLLASMGLLSPDLTCSLAAAAASGELVRARSGEVWHKLDDGAFRVVGAGQADGYLGSCASGQRSRQGSDSGGKNWGLLLQGPGSHQPGSPTSPRTSNGGGGTPRKGILAKSSSLSSPTSQERGGLAESSVACLLGYPHRVSLESLVKELVEITLSEAAATLSQDHSLFGHARRVSNSIGSGGELSSALGYAAGMNGFSAAPHQQGSPYQQQPAAAAGSPQAVIQAFNKGLEALAAAVLTTASCPAAAWGLPAPELCGSLDQAAPACWEASQVDAAATALRKARIEISAVSGMPCGQSGLTAVAGLIHARFVQWAAVHAGGGQSCLLLPHFLPHRSHALAELVQASSAGGSEQMQSSSGAAGLFGVHQGPGSLLPMGINSQPPMPGGWMAPLQQQQQQYPQHSGQSMLVPVAPQPHLPSPAAPAEGGTSLGSFAFGNTHVSNGVAYQIASGQPGGYVSSTAVTPVRLAGAVQPAPLTPLTGPVADYSRTPGYAGTQATHSAPAASPYAAHQPLQPVAQPLQSSLHGTWLNGGYSSAVVGGSSQEHRPLSVEAQQAGDVGDQATARAQQVLAELKALLQ